MRTLVGIVAILVVSTGLGLVHNHFSDQGITVGRMIIRPTSADTGPTVAPANGGTDSEPTDASPGANGTGEDTAGGDPTPSVAPEDPPADDAGPEQRLWQNDEGVWFCNLPYVLSLYGDDFIGLVDARKKEEYVEGHIPGAYWLYHYRADRLIRDIADELEIKAYLIVYCGGGECDDSIYLATALVDEFGFHEDSVLVYKGGMDEWREYGLPVATGEERGEAERIELESYDGEATGEDGATAQASITERRTDPDPAAAVEAVEAVGGDEAPAADEPTDSGPTTDSTAHAEETPSGESKAWFNDDGIQFCNLGFIRELYGDDEIVALVDARKEKEYRESHISGAYSLYHYRADRLIDDIRDELESRAFLVVYCQGGECEDSIYLATALVEEFDFDPETILVYKGGFEEWNERDLPTTEGEERGEPERIDG